MRVEMDDRTRKYIRARGGQATVLPPQPGVG